LLYGNQDGKTTYAVGSLLVRLSLSQAGGNTTPKAFASKLLLALYKRFGMGEYILRTANDLFMMCNNGFGGSQDTIIVVDG
jgi:hypothetical protein